MRALAEEAGQLRQIDAKQLSQHVLTGGIQAVVQRRLSRLPDEMRPLLRLAAVAGRQLDPNLLAQFSFQLETWLFRCADAAVFEVSGQSWRFAHDKIRESLLGELTPAQRQQLHLQVAQAIEAAYPDSAPHAVVLAEHYRQAGDMVRAASYLLAAGDQALGQGATEQAATLLEQSLALEPQAQSPRAQQVRTRSLLMRAQMALGRIAPAITTYEQLMHRAGHPLPQRPAELATALGTQLARHLRQLLPGPTSAVFSDEEAQMGRDVLQAVRWASEAYIWVGKPGEGTLSALLGANLAAAHHDAGPESYFLCALGYTLGLIPLRGLSERYLRKAGRLAEAASDPTAKLTFSRGAGLAYFNAGKWQAAQALAETSAALARQLGDDYMLIAGLHSQAIMAWKLGQDAEFAARIAEMSTVVRRNQSPQFRRTYPLALGMQALRSGQLPQAAAYLAEARHYILQTKDSLGLIVIGGQCALCALRQGDPDGALTLASETLTYLQNSRPTSEVLGEGISALVEVYLELWESGDATRRAELAVPLRQALGSMRHCGLLFPTTAPRAFLWHSRYLWSQGQGRLARTLAAASLQRARRHKLPYDEQLATKWLAQFSA